MRHKEVYTQKKITYFWMDIEKLIHIYDNSIKTKNAEMQHLYQC